jgi:cytochrome b involved in lipid metabolism
MENKSFSRMEVAKHNKPKDCWVIVDKKVYNVTYFLSDHASGPFSIFKHAGDDISYFFKNN